VITVACVYRTGGDFRADYVRRLASAVRRNLEIEHTFVCITDVPEGELDGVKRIIRPEYSWPGWWTKMELFRLPGPLLYLDLDTIIVANIDRLALTLTGRDPKALVMLDDFYTHKPSSGIMAWSVNQSGIYAAFCRLAKGHDLRWIPGRHGIGLRAHGTTFRGDQDWLRALVVSDQIPIERTQDLSHGVCSYKVHVQRTGRVPENAKLVCFHGYPRPHEVSPPPAWIGEHWR